MDRVLRLNPLLGGQLGMIVYDPAREKRLQHLRPRCEICPEENRERLANRRHSDILPVGPLTIRDQFELLISDEEQCKKIENGTFVLDGCSANIPQRIISAPPAGKTNVGKPIPLLPKQRNTLFYVQPYINPNQYPEVLFKSTSLIVEPPLSRQASIAAASEKDQFIMSGTRIPRPQPGPHPRHPLHSRLPESTIPTSSVQYPREDSTSSMLPLGVRNNSIRMIQPNLTLSTSQKPTEATDYSTSGQAGISQPEIMSGIKATDEHDQPRYKQSPDHRRGDSASELPSQSGSLTRGGKSTSANRGRTMQRRYEFEDSDDQSSTESSPVNEAAKEKDSGKKYENGKDTGHESNVTTMGGMMQQFGGATPLRLPQREHQRTQTEGGIAGSATQPSLPRPKKKDRPAPLNLNNPVYLGTVSRHTNRYEIEHIAIKSSKAEHIDLYGSTNTGSSASDYYVRNPPRMGPLYIPDEVLRHADPLESYREWRANLNPSPVSSIHVTMPSDDDDDALSVNMNVDETQPTGVNQTLAQGRFVVSHMRSRSALGIKEDHVKEERQVPVSGNARDTSSEYSTASPVIQGQGITRSATVHDIPRHRRASTGHNLKPGHNGNVEPSPLFTPLTPFIMKVTGAPAGVERGAKTLFGEHGWLEDTAASGTTKTAVEKEKTGGFMESLKRKARGLADGTSFKPVRNFRTNDVKPINISLDAREQSLLYCELEYNLNNALDAYLRAQFNTGRLDAGKLSRIADAWAQKGRPKVIGFRYDVETQIELISLHVEEFRFYGRAQAEGPAAIMGLLYTMKINARCMRVRTFCQPDSLIAKHILDAQNLVRLLGSSESLQRPIEEVAQFFKVAVDRRRIMAEAPAARPATQPIGDNSGQHLQFQGAGGQQFGHHMEAQEAGKSRIEVGNQSHGNMKAQTVKSQKSVRGPIGQDQSGRTAQSMGVHGSTHGRSRSGPRQ